MDGVRIAVGDRVQVVPERLSHHDKTAGVVIDVSAVDLDGYPLVAVDFPWSDQYVVTPAGTLDVLEHPEVEEAGYEQAPPALVQSFQRLLDRVTELNGGRPPVTEREVAAAVVKATEDPDELPTGIGHHGYYGDDERCAVAGCAKPPANPIHLDFRLRFLDDIDVGDAVYVEQGRRWAYGVVVPDGKRGVDHHVMLIVQTDVAQRSITGPRYATTPVPLEKR